MRTYSLLLLTLIGLAFLGCGDNASGEDQQKFTPIIEGRKVYISLFKGMKIDYNYIVHKQKTPLLSGALA